jgi:hypothetical protein
VTLSGTTGSTVNLSSSTTNLTRYRLPAAAFWKVRSLGQRQFHLACLLAVHVGWRFQHHTPGLPDHRPPETAYVCGPEAYIPRYIYGSRRIVGSLASDTARSARHSFQCAARRLTLPAPATSVG